MNLEDPIRRKFPYHLAKSYETASLEDEPRLRANRLVDLYEHAIQHLALVGLAEFSNRKLSDDQVEASRRKLERPSLGDWLALLRAVNEALFRTGYPYLTPPVNTFSREGPIHDACVAIAPLAEMDLPSKVRISFFLDLLVQFRNRKFGHGSISEGEATRIVAPLEAGLLTWLAGLSVLQERHLIYITHVEWSGQCFVYKGHDINNGTSIYALDLKGNIPTTPQRIYLTGQDESSNLTLLSLYPSFAYDKDYNLIYVLSGLSDKGNPQLRCHYAQYNEINRLTLEVERASIVGEDLVSHEVGFNPEDTSK